MKYLSDKMMATEQLEDFSVLRKINRTGSNQCWVDEWSRFHREDEPAVIRNGFHYWYEHGNLHRIGGPAVSAPNRYEWWINGKRHREDGPAVAVDSLDNLWNFRYYLNGELVDEATVRALGKMK